MKADQVLAAVLLRAAAAHKDELIAAGRVDLVREKIVIKRTGNGFEVVFFEQSSHLPVDMNYQPKPKRGG